MPNESSILFIIDISVEDHLPVRDYAKPDAVYDISGPIVDTDLDS